MKLCIVKEDNTIAEIPMNEQQPSLKIINNDFLFLENYMYKLIVQECELDDNIELFVGDYSIPIKYNSISGCYETNRELIFNGCFDLTCIAIHVENEDGVEITLFSDYLRIATTKHTAKQVELMLTEIENELPYFLDVCFSKNKKKSGLVKNDSRSIWGTLKIIDEIIKVFDENSGYFSNHKRAFVEMIPTIVDSRAMRAVNQDGLRWIATNPDNLILTKKNYGISVGDKKYVPNKIKTLITQYSYDTYENRVILGFLQGIIDYLDAQIINLIKEIKELNNTPEKIILQLPNTHELTGRCIYIYYKGIVERFNSKKELLQEIYYTYERILDCKPDLIFSMPQLTNTFKHVYHYRLAYECMIRWFEAGDYSFEHLNYLIKLKTLSRIYEYFCLIKIQRAIMACGYAIQETDRIEYEENNLEEINNKYVFSGNGYKLTLLYEPSIWVDRLNHDFDLYSTGYNFLKSKWNEGWRPDFILSISNNGKVYYYILDAKYSNYYNVQHIYMPDLVLKYGTQIASNNKYFSEIIGIGALYPGKNQEYHSFKKNRVGSQKESLPKYFAMTINGGDEGDDFLKLELQKLLKIDEIAENYEE